MPSSIVLGFQNTVDFELEWDAKTLESLIMQYQISTDDIAPVWCVETERDMLVALLFHMTQGTGTEYITESNRITRDFAGRFAYRVTLGGTAVRAAIALKMINRESAIHACSNNHYFRELLPKGIHYLCSVPDEGEDFHPHVIVQFPAGAVVRCGDIHVTAPRPNRVIFAYDPPSVNLVIDAAFADLARSAGVFVAASFNAIKAPGILLRRLGTAMEIIRQLPEDCTVLMEDGRFESPDICATVTKALAPRLQLFSMNEDELQDRYGRRIDILDPKAVAEALAAVAGQICVPALVCHSAFWALAYGVNPERYRAAIRGGIVMACTRFRCGDVFSEQDYRETGGYALSRQGECFSEALTALVGEGQVCCQAGLDLADVATPTTIGLGDAFIGGMLPHLLPERCR